MISDTYLNGRMELQVSPSPSPGLKGDKTEGGLGRTNVSIIEWTTKFVLFGSRKVILILLKVPRWYGLALGNDWYE